MKPTAEPIHPAGQAPPSDADRLQSIRAAEATEHRSLLRGLLLLAILVLLGSILHAGWHRVFVPGWWSQW